MSLGSVGRGMKCWMQLAVPFLLSAGGVEGRTSGCLNCGDFQLDHRWSPRAALPSSWCRVLLREPGEP